MLEKSVDSFQSWFANTNTGSPLFRMDINLFQINVWLVVILIVVTLAAFLVFAIIWGRRASRRVILAGREEMIGQTAEVKTAMNPKGTVLIQGELWAAILDEGEAQPGEEVVITKVTKLRLSVTKSKKANG